MREFKDSLSGARRDDEDDEDDVEQLHPTQGK
jgi:hypothetical protein